MPDIVHDVMKWIDHNRYLAIAFVIGSGIIIAMLLGGCVPTATYDGIEHDAITLAAEGDKIAARHASEIADYEAAGSIIANKTERNNQINEILGSLGTAALSGTITPQAGLAAGFQLMTLLGAGGLLIDNKKKDKVIIAKS